MQSRASKVALIKYMFARHVKLTLVEMPPKSIGKLMTAYLTLAARMGGKRDGVEVRPRCSAAVMIPWQLRSAQLLRAWVITWSASPNLTAEIAYDSDETNEFYPDTDMDSVFDSEDEVVSSLAP